VRTWFGNKAWLAIALAGTALLLVRVRDFGLLGLDTLACIEKSRIRSWGDLAGAFDQRLMTTHNYYRPLLDLSIAWDHALWGLEASGYQLTSVACFGLTGVALGLLLARMLGPAARVGPALGVAALVLSPLHLEVVPVVPRRGELMVAAFTLLALWSQLEPRRLARARPPVVPALWMLLALGSKDTALALWPLCPLAVLLFSPRPGLGGRAACAVGAAVPHVVVFGAFLAQRTRVVGGIGGNPNQDGLANLRELPARLTDALGAALSGELGEPGALAGALALGAAVAVIGVLLFGLGRLPARERAPVVDHGSEPGTDAARRACLRAAALGITWMLVLALVYSFRGAWQSWYVFLLVVAWALVAGAAGELGVLLVRASGAARLVGGAALALLVALLALHASASPLFRSNDDWERETRAVEAFYAELGRRVDAAGPGEMIDVPALVETQAVGVASGVRDVSATSIRAWMRITHPGRGFRLVKVPRPKWRIGDAVMLVYRDW
jgi:hypothetical protein